MEFSVAEEVTRSSFNDVDSVDSWSSFQVIPLAKREGGGGAVSSDVEENERVGGGEIDKRLWLPSLFQDETV